MKTETKKSGNMQDEALVKMLKVLLLHEKRINAIKLVLGADDLDLHIDELLEIVLDVIGVPADNMKETDAFNLFDKTGVFPENCYSREIWRDKWFQIQCGESDIKVDTFPSWVREQIIKLN